MKGRDGIGGLLAVSMYGCIYLISIMLLLDCIHSFILIMQYDYNHLFFRRCHCYCSCFITTTCSFPLLWSPLLRDVPALALLIHTSLLSLLLLLPLLLHLFHLFVPTTRYSIAQNLILFAFLFLFFFISTSSSLLLYSSSAFLPSFSTVGYT